MPTRDAFAIDVSAHHAAITKANGNGVLKSPSALKSKRQASFSRDGVLGSAQKVRNMSQSSDTRHESSAMQKDTSDEGSNPLKRRNTDAGVDYPRRRATIAVSPAHRRAHPPPRHNHESLTDLVASVKFVGPAKAAVMG